MIAHMFDECGDGSAVEGEMAADAVAVERIQTATRQERIEAAEKLEAIADLIGVRQAHEQYRAREHWVADGWASVQAEVAAAAECSMAVAQRHMLVAWDLRTKLPEVAAVFRRGLIPAPVVASITWQTHLITDHAILGVVDTELAEQSLGYGVLSEQKVAESIQSVIDNVDPDAVRRHRQKARERDIRFGKPDDGTGTVSVYGSMDTTEAAVLKARLQEMAATVCAKDPRTRGQRRAAAAGALAAGKTRLPCLCGLEDCPATGVVEEGFAHLQLYALVDADLLDTPSDPSMHGGTDADIDQEPPWAHPDAGAPAKPVEPGAESGGEVTPPARGPWPQKSAAPGPEPLYEEPVAAPDSPSPQPDPPPGGSIRDGKRRRGPAAMILGGWRLTAAQVGDLVRGGAKVHTLKSFRDAPAEARYRFSPALAAFIRSRDLTCRFPNCTVSADRCDIDHTTPHPFGSTHASNGQCRCRIHHLLKTFWVGEKGWSDIQLSDGTLIITTPSGHTYRTVPGSRRLFPHLAADTGPAPPGKPKDTTAQPDSPHKGIRMPKRKTTRAQQRRYAIEAERTLNRKLNGLADT